MIYWPIKNIIKKEMKSYSTINLPQKLDDELLVVE
jgi:hypothetical protein